MSASRGWVFIHSSDELYGADRMLLEQVAALASHADVEVWLPIDVRHGPTPLCELLRARGVGVRHLDVPILRRAYRRPVALLRLVLRAVRTALALRRSSPTTVYCTTSAAFVAAPLARLMGVPQVIGHVQEIWTRSDRWILSSLARACHNLIVISSPVQTSLPPALQRRSTVVINATPEPAGVRRQVRAGSGPLRFVVASRWNAWKGHRTLLRAWDRLDSPGHLTVLGGPPLSGESVDVSGIVARLRHPESVTLVGDVDDAGPYIDAADVVIVPSDHPEPFGLVAIEAFARERPVVASDGGGLSDIVRDQVTGWLFPMGDDLALAAVLGSLDRDTCADAGRTAREEYERHYTTSSYVERWRAAVRSERST